MSMTDKEMDQISKDVANKHNNPSMERWLRIYLDTLNFAGYKVVKVNG